MTGLTRRAKKCPIDYYFVELQQAGLIWGFNPYSKDPIRMTVGQAIKPLPWRGLKNDTYRLRIFVEGDHPNCCLQGDITVSTFNAPPSLWPPIA